MTLPRSSTGPAVLARCIQCHAEWPLNPNHPESVRDERDEPMRWCGDACRDAWMDADPKRREGWISVGDLTPERLNEMLGDIGLCIDGVGKPVVS